MAIEKFPYPRHSLLPNVCFGAYHCWGQRKMFQNVCSKKARFVICVGEYSISYESGCSYLLGGTLKKCFRF